MIGYITAEEFGKRMKPPVNRRRVITLINQGRIEGAYKVTKNTGMWLIPEDAPMPERLPTGRNWDSDVNYHKNHCCKTHGCVKDNKECPVVTGKEKQNNPCPECSK